MAVTQINLFWFVSDFAFFLKFFYIFFTVFYGSFNSSISYFALFSQNIQLFNRNIQNLSRFLSAIKSLRLPRGGQHTHQLLKQFDILLLFIHLSQQCFHQIRCLFVGLYVNPFCQFYILFILLSSLLLGVPLKVALSIWVSLSSKLFFRLQSIFLNINSV